MTRDEWSQGLTEVVRDGVDPDKPLIYLWEVAEADGSVWRYVGKAKGGAKRPRTHYRRKVKKYVQGGVYRSGEPNFREVHWRLGDAIKEGRARRLTLLCNAAPEGLNAAEALWAAHYQRPVRAPKGRRRAAPLSL